MAWPLPQIDHPTLDDVSNVEVLSSAVEPVPEMYAVTVSDALAEARPLVVQFSTPRFCISRMCGPVYEEVASLHETYGDRVRFIHLEPFDLAICPFGGAVGAHVGLRGVGPANGTLGIRDRRRRRGQRAV